MIKIDNKSINYKDIMKLLTDFKTYNNLVITYDDGSFEGFKIETEEQMKLAIIKIYNSIKEDNGVYLSKRSVC